MMLMRQRWMMKDKPSFPPRMAGWKYQYKRVEKYLKLLRRCNEFLKHAPEFPYRLVVEYDIEDLQYEIKELSNEQ